MMVLEPEKSSKDAALGAKSVDQPVDIKAMTVEMLAKLNKLYPGYTQAKVVQDKPPVN